MKKTMICSLLISLIMLSIIATPVAAATLPESTLTSRSERLERRQAILDLRIVILKKQSSCLQMARDNNALRIELRELLKESSDTLTSEEIAVLKAINQEINGLADQLRETRGDIRSLLDALRDGTPPTLEKIKSTYDQIDDILDLRLDLLSQINDLLAQMARQISD
ncbi:MAG TPA: hypothetical protein DCM45_03480 [Clostridiales bacterium]|nr:hypothetical protein [Clostridiales bacterium]